MGGLLDEWLMGERVVGRWVEGWVNEFVRWKISWVGGWTYRRTSG